MQAERPVLLGPVGGQVHHSGEADPARQAALDDGLDKIGGKESQRQQHRCGSNEVLFAGCYLRDIQDASGDKVVKIRARLSDRGQKIRSRLRCDRAGIVSWTVGWRNEFVANPGQKSNDRPCDFFVPKG
jgi:hypothetical protein